MRLLDKPIAVTMGDPSGIGPEITVKAIIKLANSTNCIVIGDPLVFEAILELLKIKVKLNLIDDPEDAVFESNILNLFSSSHLSKLPPIGEVDVNSGQSAYSAIIKAIELANAGSVSAIVTAPINKEALFKAGIKFPGHTEILAKFGGVDNVAMMLANDDIRTVLVTIHCSLRDAINNADFDAQIRAINFAYEGGRNFGLKNPRIAVAGLNPHAGEGGLFGDEEETIIIPAIKKAQKMGIDVSGPWPGDTVFMQARKGFFDVVVAQYHDQGLIPVKYLGIENGVNITLGLPFIRTSPDHGTAFDIAGKGIACADSIELSIKKAVELAVNKHEEK
jgi:4-hydroxythreonine-4-phosphate dehydrogenase